jgi:hypothetical protein
MSDHSQGFYNGYRWAWPKVKLGQCWPHIARKFGEGEYCKKSWEHFGEAQEHIRLIHMAHTPDMRDLLSREIGNIWDRWGRQLDKFWNSYCVPPWDNWSIGEFDCMLCTPSQQAQESWHKTLLGSRIPGMFKGSTEHTLMVALPQLVRMDAMLLPDLLKFEVTVPLTNPTPATPTQARTLYAHAHLLLPDCILCCIP